MQAKGSSRGPDIDTDKCVEMSGGNRFNLVIMAAARAREISRRHKESDDKSYFRAPITALLEFQDGKLGPEYIKRIK